MPVRKDTWDNSAEQRNRAVLVSVTHFDPGVGLGDRPGAARDTKRLHRILSKLGFKVDIHDDLSSDEIYSEFEKGIGMLYKFTCSLNEMQSFSCAV